MKKQELKQQPRDKPETTPLHVTKRAAILKRGNSINVNLSDVGVKVHGIAPQDALKIEVHPTGIWIENLDDE